MALALALITVAGGLLLLRMLYPEHFREYRLYLTEKRPSLDFRFDELSENWTEADLRTQFPNASIDCYTGAPAAELGEKGCYVDVSSHNGAKAMVAAFFFKGDRLDSASLTIPWWAHNEAFKSILQHYGRPTGFQSKPVEGVRLIGWQLSDGSAVFFNRDRERNPMHWSGVYWSSHRKCKQSGCFTAEEVPGF